MILVFGSVNTDLVARVATIPKPGETVLSPGYAVLAGGKGANQAVAAARVARPGEVRLAARIGDDAFGEAALANLIQNGVGTEWIAPSDRPTGCAFISVDTQGENAITVASGANGALEAGDIPAAALGADTILVAQMEVPFAETLALARRTRAAGGRVLWNLAPTPPDLSAADLADLMGATDILIVNEHEAASGASLVGPATADIDEAGARLAAAGACLCVVTAGAHGAFAFRPGGTSVHVPAPAIQPVDTTGAGDTFVGILAASLGEGLALEPALRRACAGAALACLAIGAQAGMPRRSDLAEFG